jgi:hypothetical protein
MKIANNNQNRLSSSANKREKKIYWKSWGIKKKTYAYNNNNLTKNKDPNIKNNQLATVSEILKRVIIFIIESKSIHCQKNEF